MAPMTGIPALQQITGSIVDGSGTLTVPAYQYFAQENASLLIIQQAVNKNLGVNILTLAQAQALTPGLADAGLVVFVTTFAHLVFWDGAAWQFLGADQPGQFGEWAAAPSIGWALCDGSATTFLTVGATLGTSAFTTPNRAGVPSYAKSGAAYTGALVAPTAPGISGSTAAGTTGTGTTGTGTTGTGTTGTGSTGTGTTGTGTTGANNTAAFAQFTLSGTAYGLDGHTHSVPGLAVPALTVPGLSVPGLTVPGLSVPGLSVPALGAGTLAVDATADPEHLVVLSFVRR